MNSYIKRLTSSKKNVNKCKITQNRVERLAADIIANDIDMCFVTEIWRNSEVHNSTIKIDDYSVLRSDRTTRNFNKQIGGGVVVYYRDGFIICQFLPYGCEDFEILWFSFILNARLNVSGLLYQPPRCYH